MVKFDGGKFPILCDHCHRIMFYGYFKSDPNSIDKFRRFASKNNIVVFDNIKTGRTHHYHPICYQHEKKIEIHGEVNVCVNGRNSDIKPHPVDSFLE